MTIQTVAVGTDFSDIGNAGVGDALAFATRHRARRLHLVHVVGTSQASTVFPYSMTAEQVIHVHEQAVKDASERLDALVDQRSDLGPLDVTKEVRVGIAARELAMAADGAKADILFVATHGYSGFKRLVLGSVTNAMVRIAQCPVMIVGPGRCDRPAKHVLAAVDLSPVSSEVLRQAISLARSSGGDLRIVSLFEHPLVYVPKEELLPTYYTPEEGKRLEKKQEEAVHALLGAIDHEGVDVQVEALSKSPPPLVILEVASLTESDLIVIGTSGHNAWHRMILGSTAGRVVSEATCPVLVIPHEVGRATSRQ